MTLSSSAFLQLWGGAFIIWFALSPRYYSKWQSQLNDLGSEIRSFNAGKYDQSVGRYKLAKDIRVPFRHGHIDEFAENNGVEPSTYKNELLTHLGSPHALFWALCLHFFNLFLILSGFSYFTPWNVIPIGIYVSAVYVVLAANIVLYWHT